jgi:branched-chain amino acid transport system substrate-binding protein
MEYLEGETLADTIRRRGPLPPGEALAILRPIADALDFAHRQGLVHRDIKPANILIGGDRRVTLTDFGIARAAQDTRLTTAGAIMGTPEYMSPEQAWGEEVGPATDLYSLGVVAYEMLSGRAPFRGTTPHAVLYKQIHEPPPPIRQERPDLPEGVEAALARALDKDPGKRHATAAAFVSELEAAPAPGPVPAPEEPPTRRMAPAAAPAPVATPAPPKPDAKAPAKAQAARPRQAGPRRVPKLLWALGALGALAILGGAIGIAWLGTGDGDKSTPTPVTTAQAAARPTITAPPTQRAATPPPTLPPPVELPPCEDPAGCVVIRPGEPIRIGALLYLSDEGRDLGTSAVRGIEMALDDRKELLGHPIGLMMQDAGCDPEIAYQAAEALAALPDIVAIIGPTCSNSVVAAGERLCPAGIPLISPSADAPALTEPDRPPALRCFLRLAPHQEMLAGPVAEFVWAIDMRQVAIIAEDNPVSESLAASFAEHFAALGGEIVAREVLGPENAEAAPLVERVAEKEPQLLYLPLAFERGAEITRLAREIPNLRETKLLGGETMFTPAYLQVTGEAALGVLLAAPDLAVTGPAYLEFRGRYEQTYGEPPRAPYAAPAHDAVLMILAAVEDVALRLDDGTLVIGRSALLERLFVTRDMEGATGPLSCTPNGDCAKLSTAIYEIASPDPDRWQPGTSPDNNPRRIWP